MSLNLQGDVIGLATAAGEQIVSYFYDAWGNPLSDSDLTAGTIGAQNPLRYRGYVYDSETGLYYLQSRYYDPEMGRFLNADGYNATGQGFIGNNMYAYCGNNPVRYTDSSGTMHVEHAGVGGSFDRDDYEEYRKQQEQSANQNNVSSSLNGALTIGITGSLMGGGGGSASFGVTIDAKGNIGLIGSLGGGGGFPNISLAGFVTINNADNIYKQAEHGTVVGGSANAYGLSLGGEYQIFKDSSTGKTYQGGTLLVGAAASTPVEFHGEVTYSKILCSVNIFQLWDDLVDLVS